MSGFPSRARVKGGLHLCSRMRKRRWYWQMWDIYTKHRRSPWILPRFEWNLKGWSREGFHNETHRKWTNGTSLLQHVHLPFLWVFIFCQMCVYMWLGIPCIGLTKVLVKMEAREECLKMVLCLYLKKPLWVSSMGLGNRNEGKASGLVFSLCVLSNGFWWWWMVWV